MISGKWEEVDTSVPEGHVQMVEVIDCSEDITELHEALLAIMRIMEVE